MFGDFVKIIKNGTTWASVVGGLVIGVAAGIAIATFVL
jgi:hypothetical protein